MQNNYQNGRGGGGYPPPVYGQQNSLKSHSQYSTGNSMGGSTHLSRRTMSRPPPRIRPLMILLYIVIIGVFIIGLILTIIAYWPGYSSVGGNPLKIIGPVILGFTFLVLVALIINSIWYSNKETKHQMQREALVIAQAHARSQMSLDRSQMSTPSKHRPKSILKNPSTSTYNGDAMRTSQTDSSFEHSGELASNTSTGSMNPEQIRVSMDPSGAHNASYANRSYVPEVDGTPGQRSMQTYPNQGFDMYDPTLAGQGALAGQAALIGHSDIGLATTPPRPVQQTSPPRQTIPRSAQHPPHPRREREAMPAHAAPSPQHAATPPRRWGHNRSSGESNEGYSQEDVNISNVSQTYHQYTTPARLPPNQAAPSPSVSTDV